MVPTFPLGSGQRMRRSAAVLTIAGLLLIRVPLHADDLLYTYFADYLDALRTQAGIPGLAAAIVNVDGTVWPRGFGQPDLERTLPTSVDTPFHLDGLTQLVTASLVLRCVEEGRLSLDDRIGQFKPASPDASATIREVLTHTSGAPGNLVFAYRPQRLERSRVDFLGGYARRECGLQTGRQFFSSQTDGF